jgi:hypothetical protein
MLWRIAKLCSNTLGSGTHISKILQTLFVTTYVHLAGLTLHWIYFYYK